MGVAAKKKFDFDAAFDESVNGETTAAQPPAKKTAAEPPHKKSFNFDAAFDESLKKKDGGNISSGGASQSPSPSQEDISKASANYDNKQLTKDDVKVLADTDLGKERGFMKLYTSENSLADIKHFADVHNTTPTPSEVDTKVTAYVDKFMPTINPIDAKKMAAQTFAGQVADKATKENISDNARANIPVPQGLKQEAAKPVIFTDVAAANAANDKAKTEMVEGIKTGNVKQIATFRNLSTKSIDEQIEQVKSADNNFVFSGSIQGGGAPTTKKELTPEQKEQIKNLEKQKADIEETLSGYVDKAIVTDAYKKVGGVRSKDNQLEMGRLKAKYETPAANFDDGEDEITNPLAKTYQNFLFRQKGIDAALNAVSMDYAQNQKLALSSAEVNAQDRVNDNAALINDLMAQKANLPNEYLPVQVSYVSRLMSDKIAQIHSGYSANLPLLGKTQITPSLNVFITDGDREKAIAELEKENPGFTKKYSTALKFIQDNGGIETNIAHQGFLGAFTRSGVEGLEGIKNSVKDFFGARTKGDRAADELLNSFDAYNTGTSYQGQTPDKIIIDKEGLAFKPIENENYGKTNWNTVFNGLGSFTGGLVPYAILTEGAGLLLKGGAKAAGMTLSAAAQSRGGVGIATYLMNYDHNLSQADRVIADQSEAGDFDRATVANLLTLGQAAAFTILPANEFIRNNFTTNLAKDAASFLEANSLRKGIDKKALDTWLSDIVKKRTLSSLKVAGEDAVKNTAKMDLEMVLQNHSNAIVNSLFDQTGATKSNDVIDQDITTLKDATLGGLFMALPKLSKSAFAMTARDALYDHAQHADQNIQRINDLVKAGKIDAAQGNGIISLINTASKNLQNLSPTNEQGLPTSLRQRKIQLAELVRKDVLEQLRKEGDNPELESALREADEGIKNTLKNAPYQDISKLPIMQELDKAYGIKNPLDIDPTKEYKIGEQTLKGEDILSQIQTAKNDNKKTGDESNIADGKNIKKEGEQSPNVNGNGKPISNEGNQTIKSGNEEVAPFKKGDGVLFEGDKQVISDVRTDADGDVFYELAHEDGTPLMRHGGRLSVKADALAPAEKPASENQALTPSEKKQWSELPLAEKLKAAKENLPEVSDWKVDKEIADMADRNAKYLLAKMRGEDVPRPVEPKTNNGKEKAKPAEIAAGDEPTGKSTIKEGEPKEVVGETIQPKEEYKLKKPEKIEADVPKEEPYSLKKPKQIERELTSADHADDIKTQFRKEFKKKGVSDEHIDGALAVLETRAKSWASEEAGRTPEQYYEKIAGVKSGEFEKGSDVKRQESIEKSNAVFETRDGKRIGFNYNTDKVARERFDLSKFTQIGKGSDRTVFDMGNGKVLKVAHTARGLEQNVHEGDSYLDGIVPTVHEKGLNYVVADNVPRAKAADMVKTYDPETDEVIGEARFGDMIRDLAELTPRDYENNSSKAQAILGKYGLGRVLDTNVIGGDFEAMRNWGYKDGVPYHIDGGTFAGEDMISSNKGKAPLTDPEFRKIYYESRRLKKEYGDKDKYTKFQTNGAAAKGALETLKDGKVIIHALKNPDFSTMVHELAHLYEKDLTAEEKKIVKAFGGSEPFARGFERYLREGKAPTPELQTLFEKFKKWLTDIYKTLKGSPIEKKISPEIKKIFDRLLTEQAKPDKATIEQKTNKNVTSQNEQAGSTSEVKINSEKVQYNGTDVIGSRGRTEPEKAQSRAAAKEKIKNPETNASLKAANAYNKSVGLPEVESHKYKPSDPKLQGEIAKEFPKLQDVNSPTYKETDLERSIFKAYKDKYPDIIKDHAITDYKDLVNKAYGELAKEVQKQFDALPVKVSFHEGNMNYENSTEMLDDVHNFNHIWVYRGGDDHTALGSKTADKDGLTANDKFRAVHDYFGHSVEGYQFGKDGEENAWIEHSKMFSPLAQWALSTETRGQNSFVNYSGVNEVPLAKIKLGSAMKIKGKKEGNEQLVNEGQKLIEEANGEFNYAEQKSVLLRPEHNDFSAYVKQKEAPKVKEENGKQKTENKEQLKDQVSQLTPEQREAYLDAELDGKGDEYLSSLSGKAPVLKSLDKSNSRELTLPDGTKVQGVNQPEVVNGFYSPLEKIIGESKLDKLPAKQWAEKFAKGDEAKWTGLNDWLKQQTGSVSKADIQQFLKDNRVEVVEVQKGEDVPLQGVFKERNDLVEKAAELGYDFKWYSTAEDYPTITKNGVQVYEGKLPKEVKDLAEKSAKLTPEVNTTDVGNTSPKFDTYQLEGDKSNYKEVLVTLPNKKTDPVDTMTREELGKWYENEVGYNPIEDSPEITTKDLRELVRGTDSYEERGIANDKRITSHFQSSHFDEPNILVHLRMNTRKDAEGNKVLFMEEVQSDYGQKIKKEGYLITGEQKARLEKRKSEIAKKGDDATKEEQREYMDIVNKLNPTLPPPAPFVTETPQWTKLGLKVALKEAVKQGADKIAWTTGEQQNDRYDLAKQVDGIVYKSNADGTYDVDIFGGGMGLPNMKKEGLTLKEVEDNFGKDVAQRMKDGVGDKYKYENVEDGKIPDNVTIDGRKAQDVIDDKHEGGYGIGSYVDSGIRQAAKAGGDKQAGIDWLNDAVKTWEAKKDKATGEAAKNIIANRIKLIKGARDFISSADIKFNERNVLRGDNLKVGGKGMKGFYGDPKENKLGIVGEVAKSLFKQEPKPVEINTRVEQLAVVDKYGMDKYSQEAHGKNYIELNDDKSKLDALLLAKKDGVDTSAFQKEYRERELAALGTGEPSTQHSITITPELKAEVQRGLPLFDKGKGIDQPNSSLKNPKQVDDYVAKVKAVLSQLYPNATLEVHDSARDFRIATGEYNTRGAFYAGENGAHRIVLNLEQIRKDNSGKTAFHEAIHPIVYDAFGTKSEQLTPIWNEIATAMKGVEGMDKVFKHISVYSHDQVAAEGITELLTQIADGNISLKDVPKSAARKIVETLNKLFEALGINFRFNSENDFSKLAEKIKTAFDTGNAEGLKDAIKGKNIDKLFSEMGKAADKDVSTDELSGKIDKLKDLGFTDAEIRKSLLKKNYTDEQIDQFLSPNKTQNAGGAPPSKPPVDTNRFSEAGSKEERERGAYKHLMESSIPEDVKEMFRTKKGIKYEISKNDSASKVGKSVVTAFGAEEALALARRKTFSASVNSAVYASSIDHYRNEEMSATDNATKFKAAAKWADIYNEYAELLTSAGQFAQYAYNFYKTSPLGFILSAKERLKERRDLLLDKDEKSLKEAFEALKALPEFREYFEKEVGEAAKKIKREVKAANKQKISDAFDKLKLNNNTAYATFVPPVVINGAIEAMKQAALLGYDAVDAINEGVKYIKARHTETWNEQRFRDDMLPKVESLINDNTSKPKDLSKIQKKILDRFEKKLGKLEPQARKEFLSKVLKDIVDNKGFDYDRFKDMYADALGLPSLTPEMEAKLHDLGGKLNAVDVAKENLDKDPTQSNIDAFKKAMAEGEVASRQINDLLGGKGITLDRFLSIAKLNTLGLANLLVNPFFNVWFMPVRFLTSLTKTGLDYGLKYAGWASKDGMYENTFYKQRGYAKGLVQGTERAVRNIITGDNQYDFFQKATRQNIQPIESLKDIVAFHTGSKKITKSEYANAMMEAFPTMGMSAAIISRGLQLGDIPFRFAAERGTAEMIAKQKGLTGAAREAFILNPDEVSAIKIKDAGDRSVMSQDNILTGALNSLGNYLKHATKDSPAARVGTSIAKIAGSATQPFLKIPLNSAIAVLELVVPEWSVGVGIYQAMRGNRDAALTAFSKAIVGFAMGMAYSQIAQTGLITATKDDDKKIGTSIYEGDVVGAKTLNYTGLKRWLRGGSPEFKKGDVTVDMQWLGVVGSMMLMQAQKYDEMSPQDWEKQGYLMNLVQRGSAGFNSGIKNNVFGNTSTLLGALDGNKGALNKWVRGSTGVLMNAFEPSWLATASRMHDKYKVDYSAMNLKEQMAASLKERFWDSDDLPKQITVWGEKRADAPQGINPYLYYYADITKHHNVDTDDFGYNVLALYKRTREDAAIPSRPQKTIVGEGVSIQLDPKKYEEFQVMVGKNRKELTQALMNTDSYNAASDSEKVEMLQDVYKDGRKIGKMELEMKYPDLYEGGVKK